MRKKFGIFALVAICAVFLSVDAAALSENSNVTRFSVETGDCVVDQNTATTVMHVTYSAVDIQADSNYWVGVTVARDPDMLEVACSMSEIISNSATNDNAEFTMYPKVYIVPGQTYYYQGCIYEGCASDENSRIICTGEIKTFTVPGIVNTMRIGTTEVLEGQPGKICWYSFTAEDSDSYALYIAGDKDIFASCCEIGTNGVAKEESSSYWFPENKPYHIITLEKGEAVIFAIIGPESGEVKISVCKADTAVVLNSNGGTWDDTTSETQYCILRWNHPDDNCALLRYSDLKKGDEAFIGWNTKADGSGISFDMNDMIYQTDQNIIGREITLYAQWQKKSSEQSTLFIPCGGTFEDGTESAKETNHRVAPMITRDGYTFAGWLENNSINRNSIDGLNSIRGNPYLPSETISRPGDKILYAQWIPNESRSKVIIFDSNEEDSTFFEDDATRRVELSSNWVSCWNHSDIEQEGHIFKGWNTASDGSGKHFDIDEKIDLKNSFSTEHLVILYAEWEKIDLPSEYYVFVSNKEPFSDGTSYKIVNRSEDFEFPSIEYSNRTFLGWHNRPKDWSCTDYHIFEESPETLVNKNLYLYPLWADQNEIFLVLVHNGGNVSGEFTENASGNFAPNDRPCTVGVYSTVEYIPFPYQEYAPEFVKRVSAAIKREGFTLTGWNTKADGSGIQYTEGSKLPENADKVFLYAQWEHISTDSFTPSTGSDRDSENAVTISGSISNGTVSVLPKRAEKGDTITITVLPDKGYKLDTITAKDANGNKLELTDKGDGKYTFIMAGSRVAISAEFVRVPTIDFTDVPTDAYYTDAVAWAIKKSITNGMTDSLFGSNAPCTRGQIVTFLWRAAGSPAPKGTVTLPGDVLPNSYCYDAVAWALENGITNGLPDGNFGVDITCTRGQGIMLLFRMLGTAPTTINTFTDVAADAFYADAVAWAVENGVANGTTGTTFSPNNGCTRSQIITFLYRAYQGM